MAVIGGKPQEREKPNHWTTGNPDPGKWFIGHIAGPAVCVRVHCSKRSRACVKLYKGQLAQCEGCKNTLRLEWVWYLPLYRETDNARVVTLHHRECQETLESIRLHQQVRIGRGPKDTDATWCAPIPNGPRYSGAMSDRQVDADICDWLCVLWKMRDVLKGDEIRRGILPDVSEPQSPAVQLPPLVTLENVEERTAMLPLIKERLGLMPSGEKPNSLEERNDAWAREHANRKPTRNGQH